MANYETVKIAPEMGEIKFSEGRNSIFCIFNDEKVTYSLPKGVMFDNNDDYHKKAFQSGMAFSSKPWQLETTLNQMYHTKGSVTTEKIVKV